VATKIEIEQTRQAQQNIMQLNFRIKQLLDSEVYVVDGYDEMNDSYVSGSYPLSFALMFFHNRLKHEDVAHLEVMKEAISLISQIVNIHRAVKQEVEKLGSTFNHLETLQQMSSMVNPVIDQSATVEALQIPKTEPETFEDEIKSVDYTADETPFEPEADEEEEGFSEEAEGDD